ncbi:delta14-sterol reductase [Fusarium tjaetaba]|uniref:Delta(14)-sterol reductase n=1 Tax=Fusarium tjaetaba TaxID=1567544 RepID=A0A8H5QMT9_9HYPO|nr:delta14-sterol reductase [Fusarium tjaetaba]KAF5617198.1 delta14-sterol reductase [Fusarium tjaetaba]
MKAPKTPEYEFGGPIGATGIVFGLPILMQLLYLGCNDVSGCPAPALLDPKTLTWQKFKEQTPWPKDGIWGFMSWEVTGWLFAYYFLSLVLYRVLPAQEVYGTKLRESGKALKYRFNSFSSSVVQLAACAVGTYIYGAEFPVWTFMTTNYLQLLTTSTVLTFIVSLYVYVGSFSVKKGNPELRELARGGHTGRIIYDFFIGRELNPRVTLPIFGEIDIKSWLEMRTALTGWILFNCAFIAQQYRNYGYVSDSILVIATVQAYYVLEGQYSELGLLGMMDITQDGLGFMLTWGNMVWVPFLYSTQCRYLSVYPVHLGPIGVCAIATVFAIGLYIFRSSNNQKALFRKDPNNPAFANMTFIQTKRGTKLLTGGWWGMARHINYFGDWLQSLPFSLPTKFAGYVILPAGSAVAGNEVVKMLDGRLVTPDGAAPWGMLFTYFYSAWFGFLLIHRERRDDAACIEKYGKDWDEYKSKALRFANQQRCTEEATHANELFCLLHARQAHGLYIGYKRRNAQLDALDENPPDYLAGTHIPLANDDFDSVDDSKEMEEIIDHLHVKWNTLNRVIEARRKHHAHFYSISYDYGHQAYIDKLVSHRHIVLLALGRARKRLMAILYMKEQWYSWVRDAQDDEELNREKEQKKLKQEAALFKRHMKQMEARMELMRKREDQKLQDAFLEEAYRERMAMNEDADDEAWDPTFPLKTRKTITTKPWSSCCKVISDIIIFTLMIGLENERLKKSNSIWNHASENAMSRDGWLQFSVMAKDCDLKHAIQLCRNWSEFSDLNLLTLWQYFPASNWTSWGQDRFMQQLQQLGFFPYFTDFDADKYTHHHQIGGRSQGRRQHDIVETRNILVGNMKRNDPVTRRFLQYLLMRRGELLVMVRDGKTGRVITAPDDEQLWTYRKKQGLGRASKNDWFNILEVGPDFMKLTDILREWRFGFDDYYDVFIWDFVPGEPHMDLYNIVVMELRNAWRMRTPRDMYVHMESLLRSLHRNEKTMRTRQIKPGENLKSLWDTIADERSEFRLFDVSNKKVTIRKDAQSPYMFYNKANEVEDAILFPDELTSDRKSVAFREIRNGVASIEDGILPSTARHFVKGLEAINKGKDPMKAMRMAKHEDQDNIWGLPKVWETALLQARSDKLKNAQKALLQRTGLLHAYKTLSYDRRLEESDAMEMMERDRAFSFKESFHAGDLEPGYNAKYNLLQETLRAMLKTPRVGSTDWIFFIAEILEWLDLRGDYDDYVQDPQYPGPHSFIVQDIIQAFAMIAMFFPNSDVAKLPTMFVNSSQCDEFRKSGVFDPKERSKVRPDRRTRTSYKFRDKEFWKEWKEFYKTERYFADVYPMEWSLAVRPIIAHLYQAGVIAPAYMQSHPEVVLGMATATKNPIAPTNSTSSSTTKTNTATSQ